ncbi:hypothetical protein, conserved [Babesia ovata]|uniref:Extracellular matrix-binding ebh n=1 Tax=Babesia ovata TaxID=189622 RepID=A0A2H6KJM8_9APIC|nr:uncharacterized protein BOVATA_046720 [Babesia ovata]GBE63179.1 hypothetical protein, conserved [Babesia ovata]
MMIALQLMILNIKSRIFLLQSAIAQVSAALRAWDQDVTHKTRTLSNELKILNTKNITNIGTSLSKLNALSGPDGLNKVAGHLGDMFIELGWLSDQYYTVENAYNNLDPKLKDKLKDPVNNIKVQVREFVAAARNDELKKLLEEGERQLKELERKVNKEVAGRVLELANNMTARVSLIKTNLEEISKSLTNYLNALECWIQEARKYIDNVLQKDVDKVLNEVNDPKESETNNKKGLQEAAYKLREQAFKLFDAGNAANEAVKREVTAALGEVKMMDGKLKNDLNDVRTALQTGLDTYVRKYVEAVQNRVKEIKGEKGGANGKGLEGVKQQIVDKYAALFKEGTHGFELTVKGWVEGILDENGQIKFYLGDYVKDHANDGKIRDDFKKTDVNGNYTGDTGPIAEAIKDALKEGIINEAVEASKAKITIQDNIQQNITAVHTCIIEFAARIQPNIKKGRAVHTSSDPFISKIANEIEKVVTGGGHQDTTKGFLPDAIKGIASALVWRANLAAEELESLSGIDGDSNEVGEHLDAALKVATELEKGFTKALIKYGEGEYGNTKPYAGSGTIDLNANIHRTIEKELNDKIGTPGSGGTGAPTVTLPAKRFSGYKQHVDTSSLKGADDPLTGGKDAGEGSLPQAIGDIQRGVESALAEIGKFNGDAQQGLEHVTARLDALCTAIQNAAGDEEGLKKKLEEFKTNSLLGNDKNTQLKKIRANLFTLQDVNLTKAIRDATSFESFATKQCHDIIRNLTEYVEQQVNEKIRNIQDAAKYFYHAKISPLFTSMKQQVSSNISLIEQTIRQDLNSGVKGLLRKVMDHGVDGTNNKLKKLDVTTSSIDKKEKFKKLAEHFKEYFENVYNHLYGDFYPDLEKINKINNAFNELLKHLKRENDSPSRPFTFDHHFSTLLSTLISSLASLAPSQFANPRHPELLDAVKEGLQGFTGELKKAYVNRYDKGEQINWTGKSEKEMEMLAKICVTLMEMMKKDLDDLRRECNSGGNWREYKINLNQSLGRWLRDRGFRVSKSDKEEGELRNNEMFKGKKILPLLCGSMTEKKVFVLDPNGGKEYSPLTKLRDLFRTYYGVPHYYIPSSPKSPSNIYQMLCWLAGLRWNHMYEKINNHFNDLFDKDDKQLDVVVPNDRKHPTNGTLNSGHLSEALEQVCLYSRNVLITFLGHGHADGVYACDFSNNSLNLLYPTSASACLDMLVDVLCRVHEQLYFLLIQCKNGPTLGGWADCWYGQGVGGSAWLCNDRQCPNQQGDQAATQTHRQRCDQNCNQSVNCGLKSPLQSFLEDGLPGFLPHSITSPGCRLTCSLRNHNGIPCKTPMGFSDITVTASQTKRASHLKGVLEYFCSAGSNLNKLCSYLKCLGRVAPQTLGGMFAFYYQLLHKWNDNSIKQHKKEAFENAVKEAYFGQAYALNLTILFDPAVYDQHGKFNHTKADLFSLTDCNPASKSKPGLPCGQYLHPFTIDIYDIHSKYNASRYLSWVVYITETFYDLLKKLYDECCNNCNKPGTKCHDRSCVDGCKVNSTYDSDEASMRLADKKHNGGCRSIVKCPIMHPTLYKYGFTFGSPYNLSGQSRIEKQRTCRDFCEALKKVLDKESVLIQLIKDIDEFIWIIRENFSYTLLTLWSLSLLYLLHIAVVRLDVLRIRSHLRSPSSHRIAAQSLLAAARVRALANVKYFSP